MAIELGKTISGLSEIPSFGGSEDFVVRLASSNYRAPYSKLLVKLSNDLGVSHPLTTTGDIMIYSGTPTRLGVGTAGQFLIVGNSNLPEWSTQTFLADPTTTTGDVIFNNSGTLDRLPIGANGNVLTISGGLPSWSGSLYSDPLTTDEDLLIRRSGVTSRLPVGAEGQFLKVSSGLLSWAGSPSSLLTTDGDILFYNSGDTALPIGTQGQLLSVSSLGFPEWSTYTIYTDPLTTDGDLLIRTAGDTSRLPIGSQNQVISAQSGETIWSNVTDLFNIEDLIAFGTTVIAPSALEDGYIISWNEGLGEYELVTNGSGSLAFNGGIQKIGSDVSLGGSANDDIIINGASSTYSFSLGDFSSIQFISDGTSTYTSKLRLDPNGALLIHQESVGGPEYSINLGGLGQMIVTDSINLRGLEYATDYSLNFTNESLVSRRYVDDRFQARLPLSATASNPGSGQDDYILYWDDAAGVYEMKAESGAGAVTALGTPANNQITVWTGATQVEGDANLTFNGTALSIGNTSITSGQVSTTTGDLTIQAVAGSDIRINVDSDNLYLDNLATVAVSASDLVPVQDVSDSNKIKLVTVSSITGGVGVTLGSAQYEIPITNAGLSDFSYDAQFTYNANSQLTVDNGTAALPSYTFSSDTNTGMYRFGTDAIGFSVNGSIAGKIDSSGYDSSVGGISINGTSVISSARVLENITNASIDNINLNGNTIQSTNTDGDLGFFANGTGELVMSSDINVSNNVVKNVTSLFIDEKASADIDVAGDGQLWVKNETPNQLFFTDDVGVDHQITGPSSKSTNGYAWLPNGILMQWGNTALTGSPVTISYPISFPTACRSLQLTMLYSTGIAANAPTLDQAPGLSSTNVNLPGGIGGTYWLAIGY
jgi:hypothetical protein